MAAKNVTLSKIFMGLIALALLTVTSACTPAQTKPSAAEPASEARAADGGIDGGGGDISDEPMEEHEFEILKKEAKLFARGALNYQATKVGLDEEELGLLSGHEGMDPKKVKALFAKLFPEDGAHNVFDELIL